MKLVFLLLISLAAYANKNSQSETPAKIQIRSEVLEKFGKGPDQEQRPQIQSIVSAILLSLKSNQALKHQLKDYYALLALKDSDPSTWSSIDTIGNTPISPDTPTWIIKEKLVISISELEKSISTIINESLDPYLIKIKNNGQLNKDSIISTSITYNEQTLPSELMGLVLPLENNHHLKTNIIIAPSDDVSTSVLFTFISDGNNIDVAVKEIRDSLIEHEVEKRLSQLD